MATNLSQLGLEVDKVEHQNIATGGTDKVILYASGSGAATRLYVKSGGDTQKQLGFDIDQFDALGGTGVAQGDHFIFSDGGTEKKITFSNMEDAIFGNVSGDATIAAGGALTIANDAVEQAMIADDAVGADQLASNAVVNASVVDGALKADKLDIDGSTDIGADLADADLMVVDDGAGGTNRKSALSRVKKYIYSAMSGDATASDAGVLTIAANAVEGSMLNTNAISGQTEMTGDVADADEFMVSDGGTLKRADFSVVRDAVFADVSGDATVAAGGALTIAANAVEGSMLNSNTAGDGLGYASNALKVQVSGAVEIASDKLGIVAAFAGDGLAASGSATHIGGLSVNVDDSSIEINSDSLRVKALGVTNAMLAGSIADSKLSQLTTANKVSLSALDIDGATALGGATVAQADLLVIDDGAGGTNKSVTFSNFEDSIFGNISGDATVAAGGALTIAAGAVENSMLADDAVGADELAANAVVNASIASNAAIDMDKLDGGSLASSLSDLAQGDLLYAGDVDDSNNLKSITFSNLEDAIFGNISGDATVAAGGALTIANDAVEQAMIADDAVGADQLASNAVVNASVASNAAIALNKIDGNVDMGGDFVLGNQSNDTCLITGLLKLGAGTLVDSGNNAAISLDGSAGFSTLGGFGGGSGITFAASGGSQFATAVTINKSDGSMSNDFKVFGDTAGAHFMYDASADKGLYHNGTATVLELGTSGNGFAIEVANLAGDAGKIKATAFVTYSDESLKEEVTAMDNALNAVMNLNGVEFTWKNSGQRDFGFLAQEVKNVIPQAVSVGNDGIHGVDYSRLTSVLVEAVKAQQVQIEELKTLLKK